MEKNITPQEQELEHKYYILKMKYRILYGRYLNSLEKTRQKHEAMMRAHKELLDFVNANGKYDKVCPPSDNGFGI